MQNKKIKKYIKKMLLLFALIFIGLSIFVHPTKMTEKINIYEDIDFKDNKYGLYLSSYHAEINKDYFKLNSFYDEAIKQIGKDFLGKSFILKASKEKEEEAIKEAKKELDKNPENIIPAIYLSHIEFKKGNYQKSYDILNELKGKNDTFIIKLLKGWSLIGLKENDKAMDLLETEINNPAFDNIILMNLGAMAELSDQESYEEELFEEALTTKLNLYDIEVIANYYIRKGDKKKAIEIVSDYYNKAQDSISTYALLEAIKKDKYEVKEFTLKEYMAKTLFDLSNVMLILFPNNYDIYLMYINMVLDLNPQLYMAQLMKGEIYKNNDKIKEYEEIIKTIPKEHYIKLISEISYTQYLLKDEKRANEGIKKLKELIKENPDILQLYQILGTYYKDKKKYDEAIYYYTEGINKNNKNQLIKSELYFLRGSVYDTLNKKEEAQKDIEESIKINNNNHIVLNYYAYFLLLNEIDIEKGLEFAKKAISYKPLNPYYLDTYGYGYYKKGEYDEAIKMFEYAKSLKPKNAVIINHLGDAYWKKDRKEEAKYEWKKAINYLKETENIEDLNENKLNNKIHYGI